MTVYALTKLSLDVKHATFGRVVFSSIHLKPTTLVFLHINQDRKAISSPPTFLPNKSLACRWCLIVVMETWCPKMPLLSAVFSINVLFCVKCQSVHMDGVACFVTFWHVVNPDPTSTVFHLWAVQEGAESDLVISWCGEYTKQKHLSTLSLKHTDTHRTRKNSSFDVCLAAKVG